jgi:hypothetical protein
MIRRKRREGGREGVHKGVKEERRPEDRNGKISRNNAPTASARSGG